MRPGRQLHARVLASPGGDRDSFATGGTTPATRATSTREGYLYLVDRVKDMIVTGGENVYSVEVENAIGSHPGVAQVAVIGIPNEVWGEQVHAVVVLHPGAAPPAEDIQFHARPSIAGFKVPKSVEFRTDPLPLSGALKVLKRELRKPYWDQSAEVS